MKNDPANGRRKRRAADPGPAIDIDPEFAGLIPPLAEGELAQLEASLLAEGCREDLVAWKGENKLLDGHNRRPICEKHDIPFGVRLLDFPDRESAKPWILKNQLGRRNLSPEAAAYLRGKRYLAEKNNGEVGGQSDHRKTAERLGDEYKLGEATIRRDARFATAVDAIAANCGEGSRRAILDRDTGLTRGAVARLGKMSCEEQQRLIRELLDNGKLARRRNTENRASITLPTEPKSLAEKLFAVLGAQVSSEIHSVLTLLLAAPSAG